MLGHVFMTFTWAMCTCNAEGIDGDIDAEGIDGEVFMAALPPPSVAMGNVLSEALCDGDLRFQRGGERESD